jgi:hypothetical protein
MPFPTGLAIFDGAGKCGHDAGLDSLCVRQELRANARASPVRTDEHISRRR